MPRLARRSHLFVAVPLVAAGCLRAERVPAGDSVVATTVVERGGEVDSWRVTMRGAGPVRIGTRYAELRATLNGDPVNVGDTTPVQESCGYARTPAMPAGMSVMLVNDTIVRIDVDTAGVRTAEGAQVGDTEARIQQLYAGRVAVAPHKYTSGHYLTVAPLTPADSTFRIVFETDGAQVTRYRAGRLPMVEWVEGCG